MQCSSHDDITRTRTVPAQRENAVVLEKHGSLGGDFARNLVVVVLDVDELVHFNDVLVRRAERCCNSQLRVKEGVEVRALFAWRMPLAPVHFYLKPE
jgi:hypothetical protein